jgi:predicted membrane protein
MNKSYSGSFMLGSVIVLIGLLLLIRNIFHIHITVFAMLASFGLIWLGIMLIRGNIKPRGDDSRTAFGEGKLNYVPGQESYSVVFGSGVFNLQDVRPDKPIHFNLECSFGEMKVFVSKETELQINGSASFGSLHGPDLRSASFGSYSFMSPGYNPSLPGIAIHARVTFGELRVFYL